ncbi:hypothetical protein ACF0H5_010420 [Mactra antiquata]
MLTVSSILASLANRGRLVPTGHLGQTGRFQTSFNNPSGLIEMVKSFIPPLTYQSHKGESGRVGIVGGSQEYTGAPYFAAISSLKLGADLSHVFCTKEAAPVIKSYSPELIVHPLLDDDNSSTEITQWLPRLHSLVIGPGLGRNDTVINNTCRIIEQAKEYNIPLVIDADGLYLVTENPSIISGYEKCVLTPNVVEFERLYKKVIGESPLLSEPVVCTKNLSQKMGHVTIVQKGVNDIITDGNRVLVCCNEGSPRRCGGQGDLLSGSVGTFLHWANKMFENTDICNNSMLSYGPTISAAYAGCLLTRECNRRAFSKYQRSMTTSDMISSIQESFDFLYG